MVKGYVPIPEKVKVFQAMSDDFIHVSPSPVLFLLTQVAFAWGLHWKSLAALTPLFQLVNCINMSDSTVLISLQHLARHHLCLI